MKWRKLGVVWNTTGTQWWSRTHAMGPTPVLRDDGTIRVFLTTLDEQGRGRPFYVDVAADDPTRVLKVSEHFLMDVGRPGAFDDNGLMAVSVVPLPSGELFMYYAGFELCHHIRYRIFTGLAISRDGGETFQRASEAPVLDRSSAELFFRCGPFAAYEDGRFRLWYVGGREWTDVGGKQVPVYDLRYLESGNGLHWAESGKVCMEVTGADEHGFGRPWIVRRGPSDYQMFYSIRRRSVAAYRLGYAESSDGLHWVRKDDEMGLDVGAGAFDADAIMYSAVVTAYGKQYCFYNGNNFGGTGFGVAERVD